MKRCSKCCAEKAESEFYAHKQQKSGLNPACKACIRARQDKKRQENPEAARQKWVASYQRLSEEEREVKRAAGRERYRLNPEKYKAAMKAWGNNRSEEQKEKDRVRCAEWRAANRDLANARNRAYAAANPDKIRTNLRNRRARKKAAAGKHTAADIAFLMDLQKGKCAHAWCRAKLMGDHHVDHIIPLKLGGSNWRQNLQILCEPCNESKGARHPIDHAQRHGMLL